MKRKILWLPILCLVVFVLNSPAWGQGGRNLKKITIGVPARNNSVFGILAAEMLGFDREEGLDVDLVVMAPQLTTQALIAGNLNFMNAVRASKPRAVLIQSQKFGQVWVVPDHLLVHEIRAEEALRPEPRPVLLGSRRALIRAKLNVLAVLPGIGDPANERRTSNLMAPAPLQLRGSRLT